MCIAFWKGFRGWCRSFTPVELCLVVIEVILLVVAIGIITFSSIHFLACFHDIVELYNYNQSITAKYRPATNPSNDSNTSSIFMYEKLTHSSKKPTGQATTLSPNVECTWVPSKKTEAMVHYYLPESDNYPPTIKTEATLTQSPLGSAIPDYSSFSDDMNPDGDEAPAKYKDFVAALVKLKPPVDVTFGCILTKITLYWTLTAASCIESVEEVDSLDSFFIIDGLGEAEPGRSHALADVQIHPLYQGANRSFDLAALRSADALASYTAHLLTLPTMVEYMLVGVGERLTILGYGRYRTIEMGIVGRRLRRVHVYSLSRSQCGDLEDTWAPRHLSRGSELVAGACGVGAGSCGSAGLCAGSLRARTDACWYCAGSPLVLGARVLGVMADNRQCGVACEPALYVNLAALRPWILSILT